MTRVVPFLPLLAALLLATAGGLASAAPSASDPLPRAEVADTGPAPEDVERAHWQKLAVDAYRELAAARQRVEAADAAYARLRTHKRGGGDAKVSALKEREDAAAALAAAQARVESLAETARKAGVPPGWIRVFDEDWMPDSDPADIP
jgi:hypothetical protein